VRRVDLVAGLGVLACASPTEAAAQVAPPAPEAIAVGDYLVVPIVESRVRGEYWHDLADQDKALLVERSRLGADVQRGPIEAKVVFQDARLWDLGGTATSDVVGLPPQQGVTSAFEGWIEAHTPGARPSFVRVGRQAIQWGEGRLLGVADWSPTGRSLDAARGRLVAGDWAFELLAASLTDAYPFDQAVLSSSYGELFGARVEWSFDPLFAVDLYGLVRIAQNNPRLSAFEFDTTVQGQTYTPALRLHGQGQGWSWGAEGAVQLGHADTLGAGMDRSAWAAAGHVAYAFPHVELSPEVRVGVAYASGDTGSGTYHAFDPLLPDVHTAWTGAMDLFAWSNEEEADARLSIAPWSDAVASIAYRYTQLAEPGGAWRSAYLEVIGAAPGNGAHSLGHEIDAALTWSPWIPVDLTVGYSALILGDGAKNVLVANGLGSVHTSGTGMVTVTPPDVAQFAYAQVGVRMP
jgi:hypothetical protein